MPYFCPKSDTMTTIRIFISLINSLFAQPAVLDNIAHQLTVYPQEKIHLHTDRNFYVPGEKIWFKAYVIDAFTHLYPTHSRYVYVELISPTDTLVKRVMIRPTDDMFHGHLPLSKFIPEEEPLASGASGGVRRTRLEGYSATSEFYSPNYSELPPLPDYRRTLYWNPMVTPDETGKAKIQFYNNSSCTNFNISAETVTTLGRIGVYEAK